MPEGNCAAARGFQPRVAVGLGEFEQAQTGAQPLVGMSPSSQQPFDHPYGAAAQAFGPLKRSCADRSPYC